MMIQDSGVSLNNDVNSAQFSGGIAILPKNGIYILEIEVIFQYFTLYYMVS